MCDGQREWEHWNARADSPAASCHQVCFPGRIWALILCFFYEGSFLSGFGRVDNSQHWSVALVVLIGLSI